MSAMTSTTEVYGFEVNDADEHSTPASYAYERYIDPKHQSMAIRTVVKPDGTRETLYNGRPPKITPKNFQVTFNDDQLSDVGVRGAGADQDTSGGDGRGNATSSSRARCSTASTR